MSAIASLLYPALYLATGTVLGATVIYYKNPVLLYRLMLSASLLYAGLKPKQVKQWDRVFSYAEKGSKSAGKPTYLLVHGFSSGKEAWSMSVKYLPADAHIICIDQAGHGDSSVHDNDVLSYMGFVHRLYQFISLLELKNHPLHIVGQSLGGAVAGMFAATYPECVSHVTMMCPAGFVTPEISKFGQAMVDGTKLGLVPGSTEELREMLIAMGSDDRAKWIPKPVLYSLLEDRKQRNPFYKKVLQELIEESVTNIILQKAPDIKAPAQVIWGEHDQILDPSGAEVLHAKLPAGARLDMVPRCGHVINLERPRHLARLLMDFQTSHAVDNMQTPLQSRM